MPQIGKIISDSCSPAKNNPRNGFSEKIIFGPPLLQDYRSLHRKTKELRCQKIFCDAIFWDSVITWKIGFYRINPLHVPVEFYVGFFTIIHTSDPPPVTHGTYRLSAPPFLRGAGIRCGKTTGGTLGNQKFFVEGGSTKWVEGFRSILKPSSGIFVTKKGVIQDNPGPTFQKILNYLKFCPRGFLGSLNTNMTLVFKNFQPKAP